MAKYFLQRNNLNVLFRTLIAVAFLVVIVLVAFSGNGYYQGAMKGLLLGFIAVSVYMFIGIFSRLAKHMSRAKALESASKGLLYIWINVKDTSEEAQILKQEIAREGKKPKNRRSKK